MARANFHPSFSQAIIIRMTTTDSRLFVSLNGPDEFTPVFKSGAKFESGCALARALPTAGDPSARLGLIVPKKRAPKASRRNAFKRAAREAFRDLAKELPAELGLRLVASLCSDAKGGSESIDDFKARARADLRSAMAGALAAALAHPSVAGRIAFGTAPAANPPKTRRP